MGTIKEIIERVDDTKPNAFTQKVKMAWIAELDGKIAADVLLLGIEEISGFEYIHPDDLDHEPLVSFPHDRIYDLWLEAQIDFKNGEYNKYQNTMEFFNSAYGNFVRWFAGRYHPAQGRPGDVAWGGYYITAYGLAVKQGFQGTLDDWIASLKGEKGDQGDRVELRYQDDMIQWRWVPTERLEETDAENEWLDLISMAQIRGVIIEQTIDEARQAVVDAEQMASEAETAKSAAQSAQNAAEAAAGTAKASETAAANLEAAARKSSEESAASATESKNSAEEAKKHADTIDTEQIDAKIAAKADDLFFDSDTNLLYLMSDGQIIGTGIQVATSGGGGGSALSYTIAMKNLLDSRVITVSEGTKVELKFSYASVDEDGLDDGPGIGMIIVGNATRETFTVVQGDNTVDVTSYLAAGSNTVKVQAENSEGAKKALGYTITVAAAYMTSAFDVSTPFTGDILFPYTPTGIAEKTVHFELDGAEIGTAVVTASGRQQSYTIPAQSHGAHYLRAWFDCEIEGTAVTSNVLYFGIICIEAGNTTPIIALSAQPASSVEQYSNIVTKYRVYDPASLTAAITLEANGETVSSLTVDRTEQTWTYRPMEVGELEQIIRCGDVYASWTQTVTESTIQVEAETEALALCLSSYGRSNNEENPGVWESGNVACEFQNFNFVSDGWVQDEDDNTVLRVTGDARLNIPYRMFANDFRTTGKTIEFELATREVLNYDAEVINCFSGDRGFRITAQQLRLASEQSQLGTRYKEDEHIRVTFVVEKKSENRLLLCYINGIMSGVAQYPVDDDFSQTDPVGITIGSGDCTTDLYTIRVYDNNLTRHQVLDNWIADTWNPEDRLARYLRNNIYDAYGRVVISQLPNDLCYLVLQCTELPQFKGDKKICSGRFVDLVQPERSFTFESAEIDVQGTSSQYYYVKNFKIKFKGGFILTDGTTVDVYQMNDDAIPVSTFTMKADVASSEGAFNVVLAMLYNDLCPFKTPAQEADPRVRQTIEGFPIVIFQDNGSETKFLGKYNFNNDKGTEEVFGFQEGDESWEILQNGTDRVGWHSADFSGPDWKNDFEARYPEDNTDTMRLEALARWLVSTDTDQATGEAIEPVTYEGVEYTEDTAQCRLAKFSAELADYFVEDAIIFYYLFTELFLCIDQREKNAFPTYIAELDRWIVLFYDADSSIGTDNKGNLTFDYWLEDIDDTEAGDPVYNGQNSVLWKNTRATRHDRIMAMYQQLRTSGRISYDSVIGRFEDHQSKWPEAIFNEDMHRKCLEPLIEDGDGLYLDMLQGKKEQWMKWWLYNRFRYMDSKYVTGTSMTNRITIRAHQKANIFLTSYVNMYGHVYFNAAMVEHRMERGREYEFEWPASGAEDPVIGINDADLLTSLGDLSAHMVELIDVSGAPHITGVKLGDGAEDYANYSLTSVTFGNNILLRTLDCRNCPNLAMAPDVSGCTNIEEIYFEGSAITGLKLPNGGILKLLHLPGTVANLTVVNQPQLADFSMPDCSGITTLRLENAGVLDDLAMDILAEIPASSRVRITGIDLEAESGAAVVAFLEKLDTMRGLDENGSNVDTAQVSGRIHTSVMTVPEYEAAEAARERYPSLAITCDTVRNYIVQFYNGDTLLETVEDVSYGSSVVYSGETPVKADADVAEDWRFIGWSPEPTSVTEDMVCQAQFGYINYNALKLVERTISGEYTNDRVDLVGSYAFSYCSSLKSANLPNAVSVHDSAFRESPFLTGVELPVATSIGISAFYNCDALKAVYFPLAESMGHTQFTSCDSLERAILPALTGFGASFVNNCPLEVLDFTALTSIYGTNLTPNKLSALILRGGQVVSLTRDFSSTNVAAGTNYVYVPKDLVDSYKSATNWSNHADQIRAIEDYPDICGGE